MKRTLIVFFINLVALHINAQEIVEYYKRVNEGKVFAIQNDFQSAVSSYQLAIENYDFPFARDCYNAIELSILAKDTNKLSYFLEKAVARGIRVEDLEKSGRINSYTNSQFFKGLKEKEDSLLEVYSSRINSEIREEINAMFFDDQKMREQYYAANIFQRIKIEKDWKKLTAKQVERLIEITKTYGFPGEKLIGLDRKEMHRKIDTRNFSAGMPIVLLIHHFSQPNPSYDTLLLEEVKKGNLYNEHFVTVCDFEAEFGKDRYQSFGSFGLRHQHRKVDRDELNSKRKEVGILGVEQIDYLNQVENLTGFWNRLY